ncbi:actin family protein [Cryptosporidium andersoni]|uniref:Actin family protein n=1 Tax=Cryptosporidium andersoni TaxID=117008 RepID=A0A1J4MUX2_9CRYT|nr:actin family protein [Cryptosporidium andersoni]
MSYIVFEPGRTVCRAAFAGNLLPVIEIPTVCCLITEIQSSTLKYNLSQVHGLLIGDDAVKHVKANVNSKLVYPVSRDFASANWELLELIWDKTIEMLQMPKSADNYCLLTACPFSGSVILKEKIKKWSLKLRFKKTTFVPSHILTLYSYGLDTAVVVDIGTFWTTIVPIINGISYSNAVCSMPIGGKTAEEYLGILLAKRGLVISGDKYCESQISTLILQEILREKCFVSVDEAKTRELLATTTTFLDYIKFCGKGILIEEERFLVTENVFFCPHHIGYESLSICEAILDVVSKCPVDTRLSLLENIILCGGSSLFLGFPQRLQMNIKKRFLDTTLKGDTERFEKYNINVIDDPLRDLACFKGGCIYAEILTSGCDDKYGD